MTHPRFIQIHTLQSYSAALLNRDDSGLAKRLPMGDAIRTRNGTGARPTITTRWRRSACRWPSVRASRSR
jgi:hypothetical protein